MTALAVAWYRLRATWRRQLGGYLAVVLLVGLLGGVALGAVGGARRTQSAFPDYLAATHASQLQVNLNAVSGSNNAYAYSPTVASALARVRGVVSVGASAFLFIFPIRPNGTPAAATAIANNEVNAIGSVNGLYFNKDRIAVVQGRLADPTRIDEFVATAEAAKLLGWHLGENVPMGAWSYANAFAAGFGTRRDQPSLRFTARLVGIVSFPSAVVRDQVDQYPTFLLFTPGLTRRLLHSAAYYATFALSLRPGAGVIAEVEHSIVTRLARASTYTFHLTSVVEGQAERASKPEAIALGVFGAIAGLAGLLIAGQAIDRLLRAKRDDVAALRALGSARLTTMADSLLGLAAALGLGLLVAAGLGYVVSPLTRIGPSRLLETGSAFAIDWTVFGLGLLTYGAGLGAIAVAGALRSSRPGPGNRYPLGSARLSAVTRGATGAGLPTPAVVGLRFALEPGAGRSTTPVRSALLGSVLAVAGVVATLMFGSGLATLVSHPRLFGWNWNYAIEAAGGGKIPPVVQKILTRDRAVAAWSGYDFADVFINGTTVPALLSTSRAAVGPPLLAGHAVQSARQIVLGAATLAALHKRIGDTVLVSYGSARDAPVYVPPTPLRIVGVATMPAVGNAGTLHVSMGTGAILSSAVEPPAFRRALENPDPLLNGVALAVVRLRRGAPTAAGLTSLRRVAAAGTAILQRDPNAGGQFLVLGVQQPAEILSYASTGDTPLLLAAGLAGGAFVALALTLAASVSRRRRELALLKTFGLTQGQLAAVVAWQASVAAVVGIAVGVPGGILVGRWLWILFAREIFVVPDATIPAAQIALVALAALVLANLAATWPGRRAAQTPTAIVLAAE